MHRALAAALRYCRVRCAVVLFGIIALTPIAATAAFIPPNDLAPGAAYRIAFVSSDSTTATSSDIVSYNSFIAALAAAAGLPGAGWAAIASTPTVSAMANISCPACALVPIYRPDGLRVANSIADLFDSAIAAAIALTELGGTPEGVAVWTGTNPNGLGTLDRQLGTTVVSPGQDGPLSYAGRWDQTNSFWISVGSSPQTETYHLYGISGVLTVPEPGTLALFVTAGALLAGLRRRRS